MGAVQAVVIAQLVSTKWSKRSRGQPLATQRNSVPERLLVPASPSGQRPACIVHRVEYSEINGFVASTRDMVSTYEALQSPLTPAVGVYIDGDMLHVVFEGPYPTESELPPTVEARMGAPPRTVPRRPFALHLGEWGQIRYMGRYLKPWTAFMYYEKVVCNIGLFATLSPRTFVETHPRRHFDSMPDVW